jgi:arylsulfatase A-like enzyme
VIILSTALVSFAAPTTRPNVLIILADDQGYGDCSAYPEHASDISTPNLERIAKAGVRFSAGYVSAPVCSPSRTGLLTGRYQERWSKESGWRYTLPDSIKTNAERMREAGYTTLFLGKNDFGTWDIKAEDRRFPINSGFDHCLSFNGHAHDYMLLTRKIEEETPDPHGDSANVGPLDADKQRKDFPGGYTTDIFTDSAIQFMNAHHGQEGEKPFFVMLAYNSVHDLVQQVPPKYLEKYGVKPVPLYDPTTGEKYEKYYNTYNRLGVGTNEKDMRQYLLANLNCLDDNIGRLLDAMDAGKLTDNTLVFYLSDNGGSPNTGGNNHPLRGAKYTVYEGGIRIPFMVRWPGHAEAGRLVDAPVSSLDIGPTMLTAVGAPVGAEMDGKSLVPLLMAVAQGPDAKPAAEAFDSRPLFWKFQKQFAVRKGDWKLELSSLDKRPGGHASWILDSGPFSPGQTQLFDLKTDQAEQKDVIKDHPDIAAELKQAYDSWNVSNGTIAP